MSDNAAKAWETIEDQARKLGRIAGWAPGEYMNTCSCGVGFIADKRAIHCLPCAVRMSKAAAINEARQQGMRDAAEIARAIDSGRGNEAEIARAIERAAEIEKPPPN